MGRLMQMRGMLLSQNMGLTDILLIFLYMVPFFLLLLAPICVLLSVFFTFLRMAGDNELTALKAGGVSLYRLLPGTIFFCVCITALSYGASIWGVGWGMEQTQNTLANFAKNRAKIAVQGGIFSQELPGITFYAKAVKDEAFIDVFVEDKMRNGAPVIIVAPMAKTVTVKEKRVLRLEFFDGRLYTYDTDNMKIISFEKYSVELSLFDLIQGFSGSKGRVDEVYFSELLKMHKEALAKGESGVKIYAEIQRRLALPIGCIALGLFAMPIGYLFKGLRQQYGIMVVLGLFLTYYAMTTGGLNLAMAGLLSPILGAWFVNILFFLLSLVALSIAQNERRIDLRDLTKKRNALKKNIFILFRKKR